MVRLLEKAINIKEGLDVFFFKSFFNTRFVSLFSVIKDDVSSAAFSK